MSDYFACLHCNKEFPRWYWGVSGKVGGWGTIKKPGLARANFKRHVKACESKKLITKKDKIMQFTKWNSGKRTVGLNELKGIVADYNVMYNSSITITASAEAGKQMYILLDANEAQQLINDLQRSVNLALDTLAKNINLVIQKIDAGIKKLFCLPRTLELMSKFGGDITERGESIAKTEDRQELKSELEKLLFEVLTRCDFWRRLSTESVKQASEILEHYKTQKVITDSVIIPEVRAKVEKDLPVALFYKGLVG
jgi:hypothetical protein